MARARNVKPGLLKNEVLGVADPLLTLLFVGLWMLADREGRLEDRPVRIKGELFPYRDGVDMEQMLNWLASRGFIERYQVGGLAVIQILQFAKHQAPHGTEKDSDLPAKDGLHTVHTRGKNGYATGEIKLVNRSLTVKAPSENSLTPDSLIPDSSVPNGTGGDAAKPAEELTKDELWTAGKSLLMAAGMPKGQCGSFVGKLVKDYGDQIVIEAVRAAVVARPADPAEYLKACCLKSTGKRGPKLARQAETPDETARMLAERDKRAAPQPPEVRARIAELTQQFTGRKAA